MGEGAARERGGEGGRGQARTMACVRGEPAPKRLRSRGEITTRGRRMQTKAGGRGRQRRRSGGGTTETAKKRRSGVRTSAFPQLRRRRLVVARSGGLQNMA